MTNLFAHWLALVFSGPDMSGALAIAAKTTLIYFFLIAGLRLLGKRELGQMSVYDLVLVVVISNSVQNAMVGQDVSLGGGLVAALALLIINRLLTWLMLRNRKIEHLIAGEPVLIVREGHLLQKPMPKEGVTREHVLAAMREHGLRSLEEIQMGVLEPDGAISIVSKESHVHRTRRHFRELRIT